MKRSRKFKLTASPAFLILFLVGFGAGYATKELRETPQKFLETARAFPSDRKASARPLGIPVSVCFTPDKQCQTKIINAIKKANQSVYVQAYSFTDTEIANALADAASQDVRVNVLLDKSNRNDHRSAKTVMNAKRIPLRFDAPSGIAHNKIMIVDETLVISGSYNFSVSAYKRNTENVLFINDPNLAR